MTTLRKQLASRRDRIKQLVSSQRNRQRWLSLHSLIEHSVIARTPTDGGWREHCDTSTNLKRDKCKQTLTVQQKQLCQFVSKVHCGDGQRIVRRDCSANRPNKSPVCGVVCGVEVVGQCEKNSRENEFGMLCACECV